jgi:O-acetylserine/cysteine efflux transporter
MRALRPHIAPAAAGFWMIALAVVQLGIVARGRIDFGVLSRHRWFFVVIGLLVGINTNLGFVAVRYVEPGTASLLSRTSILFGVALGVLWLGERLSRVETAGAVVAIVGTIVVSAQPGDHIRTGALLVVAATFLYALHSAVVKRWGGAMPFMEFFFFRLLSSLIVVLGLGVAQNELAWPSPTAWLILIPTAGINVVLSRAVYYLALRRLDLTFVTIILTLSPVVTWLWSIPLFGGRPTLRETLGGIAILVGVIVVSASRGGWFARGR